MHIKSLLCAAAILVSASPVFAQGLSDKHLSINALAIEAIALDTAPAVSSDAAPVPVVSPTPKADGSRALPLLYAGMIALQAMDVASTHKALRVPGAYETNPVFGSVGGSLPAQIALKAGATTGIILLTEHVKKTSRVGAIATMIALNSVYATVVARNYAIAGRPGPH